MSIHVRLSVLLLGIVWLAGCATTSQPDISRERLHQASELNAELGMRYMLQGNYDWAMPKLEKAIEQNRNNARAHHYMGELFRILERHDDADRHFKRALALTPQEPSLLNNYGVFLCDRKQYQQAQDYFNRALSDPVYPGKSGIYENLGMCAFEMGDVLNAEKNLLLALRINRQQPNALLGMAQISFDNQLFDQSRQYLTRYQAVAGHTAQSLWLGILLERRSGNRNQVASYAMLLKANFPDSREARMLRRLEAEGQL